MTKIVLICLIALFAITPVCSAKNLVHQVEDSIDMDKWAHAGLGYVLNDQLKRHTKLTPLERTLTVFCLAYAKERLADSQFDRGDIAATVAGCVLYEIRF